MSDHSYSNGVAQRCPKYSKRLLVVAMARGSDLGVHRSLIEAIKTYKTYTKRGQAPGRTASEMIENVRFIVWRLLNYVEGDQNQPSPN